jgi:hypothetical protein
MQVAKIKEAILAARTFIQRAEEVLEQSGSSTNFLLTDGRHAKILKKQSTKVISAMQEMRRP